MGKKSGTGSSSACCHEMGMKKGPWTTQEDEILVSYVRKHGHHNWRALPRQAGLLRCGKSCRLRWINYLRPDVKRGNFTVEEREAIVELHGILGNRWSAIAARLPGRTDNEIKNFWHTHLKKKKKNININVTSTIKHPCTTTHIDGIHLHQPHNNPVGKLNEDGVEESMTQTVISLEETPPRESSNCNVAKEDMEFWYNLYLKAGI